MPLTWEPHKAASNCGKTLQPKQSLLPAPMTHISWPSWPNFPCAIHYCCRSYLPFLRLLPSISLIGCHFQPLLRSPRLFYFLTTLTLSSVLCFYGLRMNADWTVWFSCFLMYFVLKFNLYRRLPGWWDCVTLHGSSITLKTFQTVLNDRCFFPINSLCTHQLLSS